LTGISNDGLWCLKHLVNASPACNPPNIKIQRAGAEMTDETNRALPPADLER